MAEVMEQMDLFDLQQAYPMSTRDDGSTRPDPDRGPPARGERRQKLLKDFVLPIAALIVGAAVGAGTAVYASDRAAQENLITAQRLAWASYLGTLDKLDRIQPDLTTGERPGPRALERCNAAYPNVSPQAAAVIILSDDATATLVDDLQDDELSPIDKWVKDGTWNGGKAPRPDLDTTAFIKHLTQVARDSVHG